MLSNKISLLTRATELSLENAEQWIRDAKLLIGNSSFGHASTLLRFSCEEIAKAFVCWFTSEKIWPLENKVVRDIFRYHRVKNKVMLGVIFAASTWMRKNELDKGEIVKKLEASEEEIVEALKQFEDMLDSTEKMRQRAIYVDVNLDKKEVETPQIIGESEVGSILTFAEVFFKSGKVLC